MTLIPGVHYMVRIRRYPRLGKCAGYVVEDLCEYLGTDRRGNHVFEGSDRWCENIAMITVAPSRLKDRVRPTLPLSIAESKDIENFQQLTEKIQRRQKCEMQRTLKMLSAKLFVTSKCTEPLMQCTLLNSAKASSRLDGKTNMFLPLKLSRCCTARWSQLTPKQGG